MKRVLGIKEDLDKDIALILGNKLLKHPADGLFIIEIDTPTSK